MAESLVENVGKDLQSSELACKAAIVTGSGEDAAIVAEVEEPPKVFYSKEFLMKLKKHPASMKKPECLDSSDIVTKAGKWDPEHWMSNNASKRASGSAAASGDERSDPTKKRERVKEETDNYCFTPQRRSFVSGCQGTSSRHQEPESAVLPGNEKERRVPATRSARDRDRLFEFEQSGLPSKPQPGERDLRKIPTRSAYERNGNRNSRMNGYNERPRIEQTPEWFSGGPTSQNETIELRGFDEESGKLGRKTELKKTSNLPVTNGQDVQKPKEDANGTKKEPEFNLDALLTMEPAGFSGLDWQTGQTDSTELQGSKFSRWFKKSEDPQPKEGTLIEEKEDAAKSLLEIMHKGSQQQMQQQQPKLHGIRTAEEVEKMANKREALADLMSSMSSVKEERKDNIPASRPMTEQDLLASLLGDKANITKPQQQQQPTEDILMRFLQTAQNQTLKKPEQIPQQNLVPGLSDLQQRPDIQAVLRNAAAGASFNGLQTVQQLEFLAKQRQLIQQHQQNVAKLNTASRLAFTPTAVMRKMTADKDKEKVNKSQSTDKASEGNSAVVPGNSWQTGTATSQSQGPELMTNQPPVANFAGLPLQRLPSQPMPPSAPFPGMMNPQNMVTDVALRLLEQQHQQQLLARVVATSVAQNHFNRMSALQQQAMLPHQGIGGGPLMPRNHFRPIQPQPPMAPPGPGFPPFMAGPMGAAGHQQRRMPGLREPFPNMNLQQQMAALHAQHMNALPGNRPHGGIQQPNALIGRLSQDLPQQGTANP